MAEIVGGRTHPFRAQAEVQRQIGTNPVIILRENAKGGNMIVVIAGTAASFSNEWLAQEEVLEIREVPHGIRARDEEQQRIVQHGEIAANRSAVDFTTEPERVVRVC